MAREYVWKDYGSDHAVLYGPEPCMVAAVITLNRGNVELPESSWRVMSSEYRSLNLEEEDTSIPLEQIKKRVLIKLAQELTEKTKEIDEDMSSISRILFSSLPEDPYA